MYSDPSPYAECSLVYQLESRNDLFYLKNSNFLELREEFSFTFPFIQRRFASPF